MAYDTAKFYPIDIGIIEDFQGFEREFSLPHKPGDIHALRGDVFDAFYSVVNRHEGSEEGDILMLCLKMAVEYVRVLSLLQMKEYAESIGKKISSSPLSCFYSSGKDYSERIFSTGSIFCGCRRYSWKERAKASFRDLIYNMKLNGRPDYYFNSVFNGMKIANTNPGGLDLAYLRGMGRSFFYLGESMLFPDRGARPTVDERIGTLPDLSSELVSSACFVAKRHGINVPEQAVDAMKNSTLKNLNVALDDIIVAKPEFRNRIGSCLLLGGTNCGYFNRLASILNRRNGGEVVVFPHGNEVGKIRDYRMETSLATEFATYNPQSVKDITKSVQSFAPLHGNFPRMSSLGTRMFNELWKREKDKKLPDKIESVMFIGFAFSINYNLDKTFPDLAYFHTELKIARILAKAGYKVLYKVHPDSISSVPNMMEILARIGDELGDLFKVVVGPFEETMHSADAFLFSYTSTTTFNWALCTRKSVVLIDFDEFVRPHSKEALDLLSKRCKIIEHSFDDKNMLVFDEASFLRAFTDKPSDPDMGFAEKYLFA